jgi:hypothetical protein
MFASEGDEDTLDFGIFSFLSLALCLSFSKLNDLSSSFLFELCFFLIQLIFLVDFYDELSDDVLYDNGSSEQNVHISS